VLRREFGIREMPDLSPSAAGTPPGADARD